MASMTLLTIGIRLYNHFAWHCYKAAFRKGARTMMEL